MDFGYVGFLVDPKTHQRRRAWVFTMVLGYSRHLFAKIVFDQRTETWVQLHVEAFGVERDDSGLNRTFIELARYYGFAIDPAPPRAPKKNERSNRASGM